MGRLTVALMAGALIACASSSQPASLPQPQPTSTEKSTVHEDSVRALVRAYEEGSLALGVATQQLADLIEPTGGFAVQGEQTPRARELFEATGRELRRRDAKRLGLPDSLTN